MGFNIISFWLFFSYWIFVIAMQAHENDFKGAYLKFKTILQFLISINIILGIVFLIYIGFIGSWWHPLVFAGLSFVAGAILSGFIRSLIPDSKMALMGIIMAPLLLGLSLYFTF